MREKEKEDKRDREFRLLKWKETLLCSCFHFSHMAALFHHCFILSVTFSPLYFLGILLFLISFLLPFSLPLVLSHLPPLLSFTGAMFTFLFHLIFGIVPFYSLKKCISSVPSIDSSVAFKSYSKPVFEKREWWGRMLKERTCVMFEAP